MKKIAFVPVKLNNERAPGKNIKAFDDGTPLIQCILKTLLSIKSIDEIYVFCSDESIKKYIIDGVRFLERPGYLDTADAAPQDIISEFISRVDADIYIAAHATAPFVTREHITECIESVETGGFDSSFTAEKIQKLLWEKDHTAHNFDPLNIPRTQDLEPLYSEVSAAYVFRKDVFERLGRRVGLNPHITEVSGVECVDIDYPVDFEIANAVYMHHLTKL